MEKYRFWEQKSLGEMSKKEWEALCDGCAKCCQLKLEDETSKEIAYTSIACKLLDLKTCRCRDYPNRKKEVEGCVVLRAETLHEISHWMPKTCAYRLLHEGAALPDWHPLITGDSETLHDLGISYRGKLISELEVSDEDEQNFMIEMEI